MWRSARQALTVRDACRVVLLCTLLSLMSAVLCWLATREVATAQEKKAVTYEKKAVTFGQGFKIFVEPGDEKTALAYYKDVVTKETGFKTDPRPGLDDLLGYFGYSLKGEDLEKDEPDAIMKGFPGGEVLVARFFAPKITDVSGKTTPPLTVGGRSSASGHRGRPTRRRAG
jgi:hypothetical protein